MSSDTTSWYIDMDGVLDYTPDGLTDREMRDIVSGIATSRAMGSVGANIEVDGVTFKARREGTTTVYYVVRVEDSAWDDVMEREPEVTREVVLVFHDGTVSTGIDHLRAALQYGDEGEPFRVYVSDRGGSLTEVEVRQNQEPWDENDYAVVRVSLVPRGNTEGVLFFTYAVDGRA